jgi:hypothetical protein
MMKINLLDITDGSRSIMILAAVIVAILWAGAIIYTQAGIQPMRASANSYKYTPQFDQSHSTMLSHSSDVIGVNF